MIKFIHHQVSFIETSDKKILHVHQYTHTASADPVDENIPGDYIDGAECRDGHADGKGPVEGNWR